MPRPRIRGPHGRALVRADPRQSGEKVEKESQYGRTSQRCWSLDSYALTWDIDPKLQACCAKAALARPAASVWMLWTMTRRWHGLGRSATEWWVIRALFARRAHCLDKATSEADTKGERKAKRVVRKSRNDRGKSQCR